MIQLNLIQHNGRERKNRNMYEYHKSFDGWSIYKSCWSPRCIWCITADTRYHNVCLELYLWRYERSVNDSSPHIRVSKKRSTFQMETGRIRSILDQGNGITLSEISDILNSKQDELEMSNKEVKLSLMEQLQVSIQICLSKKKNESLLVFSTKPSAQVIVQKVGSTDIIKSAALSLLYLILYWKNHLIMMISFAMLMI